MDESTLSDTGLLVFGIGMGCSVLLILAAMAVAFVVSRRPFTASCLTGCGALVVATGLMLVVTTVAMLL
jgi:hypothetical protein